MSIMPSDGTATDSTPAEKCTYSFLCIKRSLVAVDHLLLDGPGVASWQDPCAVRIHPDDEQHDGGFDINTFSFVQHRKTGRRNVVCNTAEWCPTCRRFHSCEPNSDAWFNLARNRDDFLGVCQSLFDKHHDNAGWRINECPRCAESSPAGYVYVARTQGAVKIGISKSDPKKRIANLQTACPWPIELHYIYRCNRMRDVETAAHYTLMEHRMMGEWFSVEPAQAMAAVESAMKQYA